MCVNELIFVMLDMVILSAVSWRLRASQSYPLLLNFDPIFVGAWPMTPCFSLLIRWWDFFLSPVLFLIPSQKKGEEMKGLDREAH